jgi:hypothetical protein
MKGNKQPKNFCVITVIGQYKIGTDENEQLAIFRIHKNRLKREIIHDHTQEHFSKYTIQYSWTIFRGPCEIPCRFPRAITDALTATNLKFLTKLCFWTLFIALLYLNTAFRWLDSVFIFMWNLLSWAQSIEQQHQHKVGVYKLSTAQSVYESYDAHEKY